MITIVNYGLGNLASIKNMLKRIGEDSVITSEPADIEQATKLILPGIGAFGAGMKNIQDFGLQAVLNEMVLEKKTPILGICLGMQLLSKMSAEGNVEGLGWIDSETKKFAIDPKTMKEQNLKIPLMGWNDVTVKKDSKLFEDMHPEPRFYFVHSYHMVCAQQEDVLLTANHGYEFVCGVEKGNIMGTQFHPEKSHKYGMKLLTNFVNNY